MTTFVGASATNLTSCCHFTDSEKSDPEGSTICGKDSCCSLREMHNVTSCWQIWSTLKYSVPSGKAAGKADAISLWKQMDSNLFLQWFCFKKMNTRTPPAHHTSHSLHLFSFFSSITSPQTATPGPSMFNLFPATGATCEDGVATDGTTKHLMRVQYTPI